MASEVTGSNPIFPGIEYVGLCERSYWANVIPMVESAK